MGSAGTYYRRINDHLESVLDAGGIKVGRQNYTYVSAGEKYAGENIYGILQAPRGDATEAIVLVAAWNSVKDQFNGNGVALALTLARYFKRMLHVPINLPSVVAGFWVNKMYRMVAVVKGHNNCCAARQSNWHPGVGRRIPRRPRLE